jgi:DNA-binding XRE family transcriptional regulator
LFETFNNALNQLLFYLNIFSKIINFICIRGDILPNKFYFNYFPYICASLIIKTMDLKIFGKILREKRNSIPLKQEELSIKSGVAIKTIHSIELGKGNPAIKTILRLFETLELDFIIVSSKNPE